MATERLTVSEVETVIRQLKDVIGARVVSDASGVIQEIHVLTESDRAPKQVVRDVESALQARLGISLDHKKVSVAQIQGPKPQTASRILFSDVSIALSGQTAEVEVHLRRDDHLFVGAGVGSSSTGGQIKAVASATLRAIQACLQKPMVLMVEDAVLHQIGGHSIITVVVSLSGDRADEILCGSCAVKQDPVKASVFATLDAINRRINRP